MTITLTREEARQILDALELVNGSMTADDVVLYTNEEIKTLRARLSAPEPEPVAKFVLADGLNKRVKLLVDDLPIGTLFYTAPSQHEDIYEEGCTPTDFRVLREANARMAQELFELRSKK